MLRKLLFSTSDDVVLTILRVALGVLFFAHGAQKTTGWFGGPGFSAMMSGFEAGGIPAPFAFLAIMAEFLGGIGLILGLLSRIAAFGIACNMVVAILTVHLGNGLFMNWTGQQKGEGYEYHILVLAICVVLMVRGAGPASVDRVIGARP